MILMIIIDVLLQDYGEEVNKHIEKIIEIVEEE